MNARLLSTLLVSLLLPAASACTSGSVDRSAQLICYDTGSGVSCTEDADNTDPDGDGNADEVVCADGEDTPDDDHDDCSGPDDGAGGEGDNGDGAGGAEGLVSVHDEGADSDGDSDSDSNADCDGDGDDDGDGGDEGSAGGDEGGGEQCTCDA